MTFTLRSSLLIPSLSLLACSAVSGTDPGSAWGSDAGAPMSSTFDDPCGDGLDGNANGQIDEQCPCALGETQSCHQGMAATRGVGACEDGVQTCEATGSIEFGTWGPCIGGVQAEEERCDGSDADCDGAADEGCPCTAGQSQACGVEFLVGPCTGGVQSCTAEGVWSGCNGAVKPEAETCNEIDDDCDGEVDGVTCTRPCIADEFAEAVRCNGYDDNCDSVVDEHCECTPIPELCGDGVDNDCDSSVDEGDCQVSSYGTTLYAVDMAVLSPGQQLTPPEDVSAYLYAILVSNPSLTETAEVRIEDRRGAGGSIRTVPGLSASLAPLTGHVFLVSGEARGVRGAIATDTTPVVPPSERGDDFNQTILAPRNAFRVRSDIPVAAAQINPYGAVDAFMTDASLLLAEEALGTEHMLVTSWRNSSPSTRHGGTFALLGTQPGTRVRFKPTVTTRGGPGVPGVAAGAWSPWVDLDDFDVIQVYSEAAEGRADLTGTRVESTAAIAVFGGGFCNFVDAGTCDHVEESIPPTSHFTAEYLAARLPSRCGEATQFRIVALHGETVVTFDPFIPGFGDRFELDEGEVLDLRTQRDHHVTGNHPFILTQVMRGQGTVSSRVGACDGYAVDESGLSYWAAQGFAGDPDLLIHVPTEHLAPRHVFRTDDGYAFDYAVISRPAGVPVRVGCIGELPASDFSPIGASGWETATVFFDHTQGARGTCSDGFQVIEGARPIAVIASGTDHANSYTYPTAMRFGP